MKIGCNLSTGIQVKGKIAFCDSEFIGLHCGTYQSDWDMEGYHETLFYQTWTN